MSRQAQYSFDSALTMNVGMLHGVCLVADLVIRKLQAITYNDTMFAEGL